MSDELVDIRTPIAGSRNVRVEVGQDGVLHVLVGPVTIHLDRGRCEELSSTLARAVAVLAQIHPRKERPALTLLRRADADESESATGGVEESAR